MVTLDTPLQWPPNEDECNMIKLWLVMYSVHGGLHPIIEMHLPPRPPAEALALCNGLGADIALHLDDDPDAYYVCVAKPPEDPSTCIIPDCILSDP
jgi:hypothetical protein